MTLHRSSLEIALGLMPIPAHIIKTVEREIVEKKDTRDKVNNRGDVFYEKQKVLIKHVDEVVKSGVLNMQEVWANIEAIEEETGEQVFLRTKKGNLMAFESFRTYVLKSIRKLEARPESKRETIVKLFQSGKTEIQIRELVACRKEHVHRCLVDAGLKRKLTTRNRVSNHNKVKAHEPASTGHI